MNDPLEDTQKRLRAIYSETTVDHIIHPRNADILSDPDGFASCNSSCREVMKIWLKIRHDVIDEAGFWTDGCAATIACGSMATELVKGKSAVQALSITARHIADALVDLPEGNFHCAELAALTLRAALQDCLRLQKEPWKKAYGKYRSR
jgi:nitrogen fixation NifU-like protein